LNQLTTIAQITTAPTTTPAGKTTFTCLIPSNGKDAQGNPKPDIPMSCYAEYQAGKVAAELKIGAHVLIMGQVDVIKNEGAAPTILLGCQQITPGMPEGLRLNELVISGRLPSDPEPKYFESGKNNATFTLAVSRSRETSWFNNITFWGKQAQSIVDFVRAKSWIEVYGSIDFEYWIGKDGNQRSKLTVIGRRFEFGPKDKPQAQTDSYTPPPTATAQPAQTQGASYDDIPF
jgi:single stranded DNA-binding protein